MAALESPMTRWSRRAPAVYRRRVLTVSRLSITPVRGTALVHPDHVELGPHGVADDRRFTLLTEDGRVFDGTKFGPIVQVRATLDRQDGSERLTLTLPSGQVEADEVRLGDPTEIEIYDRVFTVRPVIGPWADALSAYAGRRLTMVRSERASHERDRHPVSIVSQASVNELARQGNDGRPIDPRRFRMLIQVAGAERPHEEDEWLGRDVRIGEAVVHVTRPDARCVITTQDPDTGERDFPTLHVIRDYRGLRDGRKLDFGVYADVAMPGTIRVGDEIVPA
jgi:uncharacterized protein YcbX